MRKSILFSAAASILLAGTAVAQDGTDDCTTPTNVGEGTFAFTTNNTLGSAGHVIDGVCGDAGSPDFNYDMFWVVTAVTAGNMDIDTFGSTFDTVLAVYDGIDCAATCIGENDDSGGAQSKVSILGVSPGDTFLVQVGGYGTGSFGSGTLNVTVSGPPPTITGDDCGIAIPLVGLGNFPFDATGGNDSAFSGDGTCSLNANLKDVFFNWVAPADGDFTFTTEHQSTGYDSKMRVFAGAACDGTSVCLGSNDDIGGGNYGSEVSVTASMGDIITIQLGAYSTSTTVGPNSMTITQAPDGSACGLGLPIGGAGAFAYDTTGHTATGFSEGACTSVSADFFYVWTADSAGDWSIDTFLTTYDTKLAVFSGVDCTATCVGSNDDAVGLQSQVILSGVNIGDTFLIQVGGYDDSEAGPGTLTIAPTVDPCDAMVNEDAFEENDTCATATPLAVGTYTSLYCNDTDSDWYSVSIPAGNILTVTLTQNSGDTDFNILESDCLTAAGAPFGSWTVNNTGAVSLDLVFEAFNYSPAGACSIYDLDIAIAPDPCSSAADDSYEENDDCANAAPMVDGTYTGLVVAAADEDFYAFCVGNGDTLSIDLLFIDADGDIDGFLRAASSAQCGAGNGTEELADGFSSSDNESIVWTNNTGADLDVILQVNVFVGGGGVQCNDYDMVVSGSGNCNGYLGTQYCTAVANTTGFPSNIYGTGDIVAANNAFGLLATGLPDGEYGYFIGSFGQDFVANPGGSTGNLCVGGGLALARFLPTLAAIAGGQISGSVDLTDVPLPPTMTGMILSGDTFNFQLWHREGGPLSGMSNFSPGLEVTFQ